MRNFFRAKRELATLRSEDNKQQSDLRHLLEIKRRQAIRRLHEKRMQAIKVLPPGESLVLIKK